MKRELLRHGDQLRIYTWSEGGRCPLVDFLDGLEQEEHERTLARLGYVADAGTPRGKTKSRQLAPGIWELKIGRVRLPYFYEPDNRIVITHGFVKRGQKAPKREIDRALEIRGAWRS